ncbi:MAG: hypothetical protein AAF387_13960 [Pseudomonadota bacterium]
MTEHPKEPAVDRQMISGRLSQKAAAGWRDFCDANGVSLTAFLEVAGLDLADDDTPSKIEARRQMVAKAKLLDTKRRGRR